MKKFFGMLMVLGLAVVVGCSEGTKKSAKETADKAKADVKEAVKEGVDSAKEATKEGVDGCERSHQGRR